MAISSTYRIKTLKVGKIDTPVNLNIIGLGTKTFRFAVLYEFLSCEIHYNILGERTIYPLIDHYEPKEIEDWHKEDLELIDADFNANKNVYFKALIEKINEDFIRLSRVNKMLTEDYDKM